MRDSEQGGMANERAAHRSVAAKGSQEAVGLVMRRQKKLFADLSLPAKPACELRPDEW